MTPEERQAIRERVNKAADGPWDAIGLGSEGYEISANLPGESAPDTYDRLGFYGAIGHIRSGRGWEGLVANAQFIAHAREDVPRLLDEVERLRAELLKIHARIMWGDPAIACVEVASIAGNALAGEHA